MKKLLIYVLMSLITTISSYGQRATNADGSIKFRGNVAVLANCEMFEFKNGEPSEVGADSKAAMKEMTTALRVLATEKFGNIAFGIVNRDDEAAKQVQALINENKLEDYLNGYSVQAKNEGADWLFIINMTLLNYGGDIGQVFLDTRLVNVENNLGYHHHYATKLITADKLMSEASQITRNFIKDLDPFLYSLFPEQYFIAEANGKNLALGAYQTNGRILPSDKFYAYKFKSEPVLMNGQKIDIQTVENIGVASNAKMERGKLLVKADSKLNASPEIVLMRNLPEVTIWQPVITATYFGLDYNPNSMDGFARQRVNNAVLAAITENPFIQLIEQETIEELHKERELQKSEDFLNGHTVDQMKAIGAGIILKVDDYKAEGLNAKFKLSVIDVASNQIVRQVEIESTLDDLEKAIRKNLYDRFSTYACIGNVDKNGIALFTPCSIPQGTSVDFYATLTQKNPMTGEDSYIDTLLASGEVIDSNGQQSIVKPSSKTQAINGFNDLKSYSEAGNFRVKIDGSKLKFDTYKDVKSQKPKRSFFDKLNNAIEAVSNSGIITVGNNVK